MVCCASQQDGELLVLENEAIIKDAQKQPAGLMATEFGAPDDDVKVNVQPILLSVTCWIIRKSFVSIPFLYYSLFAVGLGVAEYITGSSRSTHVVTRRR